MVCDINTPTRTYHTFTPRPQSTTTQQQPAQHQRRAHRVRILMTRGVQEFIAIRLSKKRGSAWQPLSSRWIECRESEWVRRGAWAVGGEGVWRVPRV
ncbi:hypothetical protein TWF506_005862 [Arthrobotrys conoides]|uniref:Uncharacterized protein n=1 Tax=Arthrobotrys conoides TaxID=74498 RepID=A0AAN8NK14_9PEZI